MKKSKISGVAQTSVLFSVQGGSFEMTDSFGKVTCDLGRIAELFESESVLKNNVFTGELSKPLGTTKPVYVNSKKYFGGNTMKKYKHNQKSIRRVDFDNFRMWFR